MFLNLWISVLLIINGRFSLYTSCALGLCPSINDMRYISKKKNIKWNEINTQQSKLKCFTQKKTKKEAKRICSVCFQLYPTTVEMIKFKHIILHNIPNICIKNSVNITNPCCY